MCDIDTGEYCEVWRETKRLARKEHRCDCCYAPIKPGSFYWTHFSLFEGDTTSAALCKQCFDDRKTFSDAHGGFLPNPIGFYESLVSCIEDDDDDESKRWVPMRDRIRASRMANAPLNRARN